MYFRILLLCLLLPFSARAEGPPRLVGLDDTGTGGLMIRTGEPGRYIAAPLLATDIAVSITGPLARTTITQRFRNRTDRWVEGVYVFPLPDDSAVDTLRMRIGDRFIEGQIMEKAEARAEFAQAREAGKRAALVEQQRPNLFTNTVANIGPGETIVAQIEYQQVLSPRDGRFELRIPLVVAPRYNPAPVVQQAHFGTNGWAVAAPQPPLAPTSGEALTNPVTLTISLAAGFRLAEIESRYHEISITRREEGRPGADAAGERHITLTGPAPADRDFVLTWAPEQGTTPQAALFGEDGPAAAYRLLLVTPPAPSVAGDAPPRDVIFIQDVSGSMAGESIRQARAGLARGLRRLRPQDRFNLVTFNDGFQAFADGPVHATPDALKSVLQSVERLEAGGGTNMAPALDWALSNSPGEGSRLRQIIFLTDGAVGNDEQMLALIRARLGTARLFTVGIGSAPNSYFMTRAAEIGRGTHTYIGDLSEVTARMDALFAKIQTPRMTDLHLRITDSAGAEVPGLAFPNPLPDLHADEPLVIAVRADATGEAVLTGNRNGTPWSFTVPLDQAARRPGIARLWARARIHGLEAERLAGGRGTARSEAQLDDLILETALTHGLTSRMTSLIAVDATPVRPAGAPLAQTEIALNLPAGWDEALFLPEEASPITPKPRATAAPAQAPALDPAAPASAGHAASTPATTGGPVPKGAANWRLWVFLGGALCLVGLLARPEKQRRDPFDRGLEA